MSSSLKQSVKLRLAFNSYNRCAFPDCQCRLTAEATINDEGVIIGEAAHIRGEKLGSARHDPEYPATKVNSYENLIFLCATHHTQIDKQGASFTVEAIENWKTDHETKMREKTEDALPEVSFAELEIVTTALVDAEPKSSPDLSLIPPKEKIEKNGLSQKTRFLISVGLSKATQVRDFIHDISTTVPRFDERLVGGFRSKYDGLWEQGLRNDQLFDEMLRFACLGKTDPIIHAAGLAVLSHLFETCEVFEK